MSDGFNARLHRILYGRFIKANKIYVLMFTFIISTLWNLIGRLLSTWNCSWENKEHPPPSHPPPPIVTASRFSNPRIRVKLYSKREEIFNCIFNFQILCEEKLLFAPLTPSKLKIINFNFKSVVYIL